MRPRSLFLVPVLLAVMACAAILGSWVNRPSTDALSWGKAPPEVRQILWPEPRLPADFSMHTQHGDPFGPGALEGHWSFLFFGYLGCPDVCPTGLHAMVQMRRHLIARSGSGRRHQFIFVTVDPDHDPPELIRGYLAHFDPDFIGLHGSMDQTSRLADSLAVKFVEIRNESGYRGIDHTSSVMVVDPSGRVVGALPPPLQPERMVEQFERLKDYLAGG